VGEEGAGAGPGRSTCRATLPSATGVHVTSLRGAGRATAASMAALSRHYSWRDQTGYTA